MTTDISGRENGIDGVEYGTGRHRLTVGEILAANDIVEEEVEVPEWGGTVLIRAFTKQKQQEMRAMATDPRTGKISNEILEMQAFIQGVVEPQFAPVQQTELKQKSAGAIERVLKRILAISGMTVEAVEEAHKSNEVGP